MEALKIKRRRKTWVIVTAIVAVLLFAVNLVLTSYLSGLMDAFFGGERQVKTGTNEYFTADEDANTKEKVLAKANALVETICEEGAILLKNEGNALPLTGTGLKVSVFGNNSVNLVYGSSGSAGGSTDTAPSLFDSLTAAGFEVNPVLRAAYEKSGTKRPSSPSMGFSGSVPTGFATGEAPVTLYTDDVKASFADYADAAIVVISRTSGESYDLPMSMIDTEGAFSDADHYLELDRNEQEMLRVACENFGKVILVINSSTPIELGFLDAAEDGDATVLDYDFASHIQAAIQIGLPGERGIMALGRILSGEVNPSGRTVDTYARDFTAIPAAQNFGCVGVKSIDCYTVDGTVQTEYFIDYEEGIYVGYRYYETRGYTDGEDWYQANVVYPFGYGLSYTTFTQEITATSIPAESAWSADTAGLSVTVRVTNTGSTAGKEVVQLYATAPYSDGGIEKSHKNLIAYAKTALLQPGESQEVVLTFDAYDLASYDSADANANGFAGYELEAGEYVFTVGKNAHEAWDSVTTTLISGIQIAADTATGYPVENRFDDADDQLTVTLSRADWEGTMPAMRTAEEKAVSASFVSGPLKSRESGNPLAADSEAVQTAAANRPAASVKKNGEIQLHEMIGVAADDPKWDAFLRQMTANELFDIIKDCAFKSPADTYIGKPVTIDLDGPAGFTNSTVRKSNDVYGTCFYMSESVLAATWNQHLAYEMGISIGNEGIVGDERGSGATYNGLYAPGVNLHRTPFGGRNPEYYSEDPVLSGTMAAQMVTGAKEKGVYTFLKHFAVNDQETHRNGICTWLTEQTMRELYLKPFEIAVKSGGATGVMTSFNRIGTVWAGGSYPLVTEVLRNEWGFDGAVQTDFASGQSQMDLQQMVYAGGDMWLDTITPAKWFSKADALDVYLMQESVRRILYTVANSNAMNGIGEGAVTQTYMAYWRIALIAADVVIALTLAVWGLRVWLPRKRKAD